LEISFHQKNATEASLTLKIGEPDYQARVASRIKEYSKKANVKGFRPGNVPSTLIQQMYGRSILMEEVNTLLSESLVRYLKENEIHALAEPMPVLEKVEAIDWEHQRDFELEYIIGMAGPFSCKLSKEIEVTAYKISHVAAQTVDDLVEQLRQTYGRVEVVAKSAANDVIHGELRYPAQDFKLQTKIAVGEEVAEKVRKIFTNLSPKEKITFDTKEVLEEAISLPGVTESMYSTMLRSGGAAEFTVAQVQRLSPAVLAQEFFDKVLGEGVARSEQEFRKELQTRLLQKKQEEANFRLEASIQAILLKEAAIALPDDFLKSWLQEKNNTVPREQIETYYQQYAKEVQWDLLVAALSKEHHLQVTQEEVVNEVHHRLQASLGSNETAQQSDKNTAQLVQNFLQQNNGKNYRKVHESVHVRKLINFIKDQITILTQEVSVEAFDKLVWE
jgi:trigger factor